MDSHHSHEDAEHVYQSHTVSMHPLPPLSYNSLKVMCVLYQDWQDNIIYMFPTNATNMTATHSNSHHKQALGITCCHPHICLAEFVDLISLGRKHSSCSPASDSNSSTGQAGHRGIMGHHQHLITRPLRWNTQCCMVLHHQASIGCSMQDVHQIEEWRCSDHGPHAH